MPTSSHTPEKYTESVFVNRQLNRSSQWAPHHTHPTDLTKYMKFVTWDSGSVAFHDTEKGRAQAKITVYLIEKFEVRQLLVGDTH